MTRDHLAPLRLKIDKTSPHTNGEMVKKIERLRRNDLKRWTGHQDRLRLYAHIANSQQQEALKSEKSRIEGYQSRMNLPQHLRQRLGELETELANLSK